MEDPLGKREGRAPSYLPFLLIILIAFAGLPVSANVVTSPVPQADTLGLGLLETPRSQSDDIRVGNKTVGNANVTYSPDQVVLKYRPLAKKTAAEKHSDVKSEKRLLLERVVLLNVTEGKVKDIIEKLRNDPDVEYVEPNYIRTASFTPNDPYYSYQWHFTAIQMNNAWDISTGLGVTVAVIDTGVAYENYLGFRQAPDLSGTTFVPGWDFVNNDAYPNDDNGHGTHVSGTIAQTTNNGIGVAGMAYNALVMPVKVLDSAGNGYDTWVADGIVWAVDHGSEVVNLSLGGADYSQVLQDAVNYAYNHGVTVVAASGNDGGSTVSYPAACLNAIAVGAVRYDQTRSYYSNYGSALDFVAPGGDLRVDQNGDGYADGVLQQTFASGDPTNFGYYFYQGTSMAAPHVSGLAVLLYSVGVTTPDQIRQKMIDAAKDLGAPGWDPYYGYGLIQAYNSLVTQITVAVSPPIYDLNIGSISVDGSSTTTPKTFTWASGSIHTLTAASTIIIIGEGRRYVFVSWSDGGAQSHTITTPSSPTTYTANFKTQYQLAISVSPSGGGSTNPATGSYWYDSGSPVTISAAANTGYSFYYWSLDGTNVGSSPSYSVLMSSPHTLTAFFRGTSSMSLGLSATPVPLSASVTLSGSITPTQPAPGIPAGTTVVLSYTLDGTTWNVFVTTATSSGGAYSVVWYPPYPNTYQIRASWSGNGDYAGATSSTASLTVTGTPSPQVMLLVTGPLSVARGGAATFDVLVTNPGSSLTTTLYIEVIGPSGYEYFDTLQVAVVAGSTGRYQFTWQAPSTTGSYQVFVGLIPPRPASVGQTQIAVT